MQNLIFQEPYYLSILDAVQKTEFCITIDIIKFGIYLRISQEAKKITSNKQEL